MQIDQQNSVLLKRLEEKCLTMQQLGQCVTHQASKCQHSFKLSAVEARGHVVFHSKAARILRSGLLGKIAGTLAIYLMAALAQPLTRHAI